MRYEIAVIGCAEENNTAYPCIANLGRDYACAGDVAATRVTATQVTAPMSQG